MTEEGILAATVGNRKPLNSSLYLQPYDSAWPSMFTALERRIQDALGDRMLFLEHVGSTPVPELPAKPMTDMVLGVQNSSAEVAYADALEDAGFALRMRELDWYEHRFFKTSDPRGNLHVFSRGWEEIDRVILFRDWMRTHAEDRLLYEGAKRELAARTWKYTQNYADAKSEVVEEILSRDRGE